MKGLIFAALAALCLTPVTSVQAAYHGRAHSKKDIQMLRDSANALKTINPDLSDRLDRFADRESSERETNVENQPVQKEDVQLLHDSADALKDTRPDLSKKLNRFAAKEKREEMREAPSSHRMRMPGEPTSPTPGNAY